MASKIESLFDAIAGKPDTQSAGPAAVVYAIILGVVSGFFVTIMLLLRRRQVLEEHNHDVKEEALIQERENLKLADNTAKREAATLTIAALINEIESHKVAIADQDKQLADLAEKLSTVNSWNDLVIK